MDNVNISIIMPLYNSEKYLEESLESVLRQTFTNYELICVNDGSTDGTLDILEKFLQKDSRLRIVSNSKRLGAAYSRNKGMGMANGEYLAFLDGDDIFDEMMLEKAYDTLENKAADIVMFDYKHVPTEQIHNKQRIIHGQEYKARYCKNTFTVSDCAPCEFAYWTSAPWNKLYRKTFIRENYLEFQDLSCNNDVYFVCMALLLSSGTIVLEDDRVMVYVREHSESGRISCDRDSGCAYKALMQMGQELVKRDKFKELSPYFYYRVFFSLKYALEKDRNIERARTFYNFIQEEGIHNLCALDKHHNGISDQYIRTGLERFAAESFESGWFHEESILKAFLYSKKDKVVDLYEKLKKAGKRIAIWGCGNNGKVLLEFCIQHKLEVEAVIDKSKDKQGSILQGYIVVSPEGAIDRVQAVIISACLIYDDVKNAVGERDIEVIDINQFLCFY
ncbi:MAG: glycosyltransferase [Lachnospiraceae bacterium]|nr:glycosyltransferase [Lachnospiraceae bacterium]